MSDLLLIQVSDECFVCKRFMESNQISVTYSVADADNDSSIASFIEEFTGVALLEEVVNGAFICRRCFGKFKEYHEHVSSAKQLRSELTNLFFKIQPDFSAMGEQEIHQKEKPKIKQTFICTVCGKILPSRAKHRDHSTVHSDMRSFSCPYDGLNFKTKDNLNQHLRTHVNFKLECDHCGKLLKNKTTMSRHMQEHSQSKVFRCHRCGWLLKNKSLLATHMSRHDDVRIFCCDHHGCGKSFHSKAYLQKHLKTHQKNTNHKCLICFKSFTQRCNLRKHIEVVHEKPKKVQCNYCDSFFIRKQRLADHMRRRHQVAT